MQVELTNSEQELVKDVLAWWVEGMPEARQLTEELARSVDELCIASFGFDEQVDLATRVLLKLEGIDTDG